MHLRRKESRTNEPITLISRLVERELLHKRTEYIRDGLVQRTRLVQVDEFCLISSDSMCQLMPDNVNRNGEAVEYITITVAKHHTLSIPERVVILLVIVNCS